MADYKQVIPQIKKFEGGLSKAETDSARFYPVPDGSGFHTNKGVTWKTFESLAPYLGYEASAANFYRMPDAIWYKIFKKGYWDQIGGDKIKSQAIANTLADFAWGAGPGTAAKVVQRVLGVTVDGVIGPKTIAAINTKKEKELFDKLVEAKKTFYLTLPNQQANYTGWANRLEQEKKLNSALIVATVSLVGITTLAATIFFL